MAGRAEALGQGLPGRGKRVGAGEAGGEPGERGWGAPLETLLPSIPGAGLRGWPLRARGRLRLGRQAEGRGLRIQKGLISFCSTS